MLVCVTVFAAANIDMTRPGSAGPSLATVPPLSNTGFDWQPIMLQ